MTNIAGLMPGETVAHTTRQHGREEASSDKGQVTIDGSFGPRALKAIEGPISPIGSAALDRQRGSCDVEVLKRAAEANSARLQAPQMSSSSRAHNPKAGTSEPCTFLSFPAEW